VVRSTFLPTLTAALREVFPGPPTIFSPASARRRHLRPIAVTPRA
jgi:hypothetical protein